jgi:hypothetical protein
MLLLQAFFAINLAMHTTSVLLLNKLCPESCTLGQMARRRYIRTICRPWASGPYGDVKTFPANAKRDIAAFDWINALTEDIRREVIL